MNVVEVISENDQQNCLLVEGKDDEHVFYNLLEYYKIPECFTIKNKEGRDKLKKGFNNLLATLDVELDRSGLSRLGVVIDADTDSHARWQSLCSILSKAGYTSLPLEPLIEGTIVEQVGRPTVGIWIMPNNQNAGAIEDFVSSLIPLNDVFWPLAQDAIKRVVEVVENDLNFRNLLASDTHCRKVYGRHINNINRSTWRSKACLRTWLAWQEEPGEPMGSAIKSRYVDANIHHAQRLIKWICKLFAIKLA